MENPRPSNFRYKRTIHSLTPQGCLLRGVRPSGTFSQWEKGNESGLILPMQHLPLQLVDIRIGFGGGGEDIPKRHRLRHPHRCIKS